MERIKLDYSNCMREKIGEHGIEKEILSGMKKAISSAHEKLLEKKRDGKLGFAELPYKTDEAVRIKETARKLAGKCDNFVVLGIGGSALGNIALQSALNSPFHNLLSSPRIFVMDNIDPVLIAGLMKTIDVSRTVFNVITKSGTTAETMADFMVFRKQLIERLGAKNYASHVIATTDSEKGLLRELAKKEGYLSFTVPSNVGGRFSVLSPVGLVSASFAGIDIEGLLEGARFMAEECSSDDMERNPAYMYAAIQYLLYGKGRTISVMMPYAYALKDFADWFRQLWAESLGKKVNLKGEEVNIGPTPVKALGPTDQHSQVQLYMEGPFDKVITFLSVEKFAEEVEIPDMDGHYLGGKSLGRLLRAEENATRMALTKEKRANCTIILPEISPHTIGQFIYMLELATACAGELFGIDAFNQPGVELGKVLTNALMDRPGYEGKKKEIEDSLKKQESTYIV